MEATLPCKMETRKRARTLLETATSKNSNSHNYACLVGSSRVHKEAFGTYSSKKSSRSHRGIGVDYITRYNLVHKFIPMPQAMKIPDVKAAVDKECEKLEKVPAWQLHSVTSKKDVLVEAQKREK